MTPGICTAGASGVASIVVELVVLLVLVVRVLGERTYVRGPVPPGPSRVIVVGALPADSCVGRDDGVKSVGAGPGSAIAT